MKTFGVEELVMISTIKKPTKTELIKNLQSLKNPNIEVFEVFDQNNKNTLFKNITNYLRFGNLSIIIVRNK
jgi:hypothetical protein